LLGAEGAREADAAAVTGAGADADADAALDAEAAGFKLRRRQNVVISDGSVIF